VARRERQKGRGHFAKFAENEWSMEFEGSRKYT
jgi:hypothetical protein